MDAFLRTLVLFGASSARIDQNHKKQLEFELA